ncbi:ABC transporter ATP-binding protein [Halococcus hamelinensis]|uniref:Nickel import system ATP-binding protein NikD n=1 Tax=Halococcus hamelinensis 100A6 TaxID=1132509 RepID=M0M350_9EURY|nr:ABC transporter ATP-binding protein [Halococcus hamelinensis]EMA40116.1 oligopeptide/dipeptide ABC transporter ATPase [Halococcus hamelinensis 100A6]
MSTDTDATGDALRFDRRDEEPILSVDGLRTAFFTDKETIRAVDGVSFDVHDGETVGIVGESGSGKSVTARSIMGLTRSPGRVLDGSIRFRDPATVARLANSFGGSTVDVSGLSDDERADATDENDFVFVEEWDGDEPAAGYVEVTRASPAALRKLRGKGIAMIFQDPLSSLNPVYTVGNQIKEALRLHQGLRGQAATEEAVNLLEAVSIPDAKRRIGEYPHQFSGGMRQRAVIAMALACEPELLICDEPTTALDVTIQAQILELLADIQEERGLSIVFITHDMGVMAEVADRLNVMYAGEVVETAPVGEVFANPKHPYTEGLLESIPGRNVGEERLRTIEGDVPTPNEPPTYCRFAPRCPEAFAECDAVHPVSVSVNDAATDHTAACLLYPEDVSREEAVETHRDRGEASEVTVDE